MQVFRWLYGQPYLLLTLTALLWSGNAVAGRIGAGNISPFALTSLRWLVAMAIVLPFAWPHLKRDWPAIRPRLLAMAALGATGFALFNNLMYLSLNHTTAINVAIVQGSMPLVVFVLNYLIFRIQATNLQIAGFVLTMIGIAMIASNGSLDVLLSLAFNRGDLIMTAAIAVYGIYSVFLRNKPDIHWLSFIATLGTAAFIISLPFVGWEIATGTFVPPNATGWSVVLYAATFPAIISQVFWMRGLELIGSNRGGIFINLVPIFGAGLAILILDERFHAYHGAALALVLGGVWLSQQKVRSDGEDIDMQTR